MKRKIRKITEETKGITLVALTVTIIVLLILSGVAISFTLGEEGIFKRAKEGAEIYQNASKNEKVELDKVSNYIDNYLKENNEDKEEKSEVEKAIEEGTVYKENTTIYDKYSNPVKVPAGFKLAQDSGTDVTKGVVIEDVEAGDVKYNENGDIKTINFGRYEFETNPAGVLRQSTDNYTEVVEIDIGHEYNYTEIINEANNITAKNLGDFITKAKSSKGYYIGRFETGKVGENTNTFNIKKNKKYIMK